MTDSTLRIDRDGTQYWVNSVNQTHRIDGPAVIHANGTQEWFENGQRHRTDGPAWIDADGTQEWFENGQQHRTDGPAVIDADGSRRWYRNGQCHRTDGPAMIDANGSQYWWVKGQNITSEVDSWMVSQEVIWPWDSSTQTLFTLTFGV